MEGLCYYALMCRGVVSFEDVFGRYRFILPKELSIPGRVSVRKRLLLPLFSLQQQVEGSVFGQLKDPARTCAFLQNLLDRNRLRFPAPVGPKLEHSINEDLSR